MHVLHTVLPSLHHVLVVSAHRDGVHDYTVLPHSVAPQDKLHSTLQAEYRVSAPLVCLQVHVECGYRNAPIKGRNRVPHTTR